MYKLLKKQRIMIICNIIYRLKNDKEIDYNRVLLQFINEGINDKYLTSQYKVELLIPELFQSVAKGFGFNHLVFMKLVEFGKMNFIDYLYDTLDLIIKSKD